MKSVFVYQIIDEVSEGVIATFISPNDVYANRQFKNFLTDPKLKDSIVGSDFFLVKSAPVDVYESYNDYCENDDIALKECFVSYGSDILVDDKIETVVRPAAAQIVKEALNEA